jgi:catalase (peroxidase I)
MLVCVTTLCLRLLVAPGGKWQFEPALKPNATAEEKADGVPEIFMLTTDVALLKDPVYLNLVKHYAKDFEALTKDFGRGESCPTSSSGMHPSCLPLMSWK